MVLRALLFSKNPETASSIGAILEESGLRGEICADMFSVMEKGTKQAFPCIIVDWADQPESGHLLRRARESQINRHAVALAIVDSDLTEQQMGDNRIDFLIYRPIAADEVRAVLANARQQIQVQFTALGAELRATGQNPEFSRDPEHEEDPNLVALAADLPEPTEPSAPSQPTAEAEEESAEPAAPEDFQSTPKRSWRYFRATTAVILLMIAGLCGWRSRASFKYLAHAPEGAGTVLRESLAALFFVNHGEPQSLASVARDSQQDAYFSRSPLGSAKPADVAVVNGETPMPEAPSRVPAALDIPLPTPRVQPPDPVPVRIQRPRLPDSLQNSEPIPRPMVVTVNPALMPVSAPASTSSEPMGASSSGPVQLTEQAARALILHSVEAAYPTEALEQRLQGPVVLQARIGCDGNVQELKIVRGYFVLGKAAVAAVQQWKFRPYNVNGHPVETETEITVNFNAPPA